MTARGKLEQLARIAGLIRDEKLEKLARAKAACLETHRLLDALGDPAPSPHSIAEAIEAERHDHWRARRRANLNMRLAQEMAVQLDARDEAKRAFGRAEVMRRLSTERS